MPFIRVKSAVKSDPQHEFDVSVGEAAAHAELYTVVDPDPVDAFRAPTYAVKARPKSGGNTKEGRA